MPIAGNDEPGAKPIARYSSDYIAGIPIKKRRFLLDLPASPSSSSQVQSLQTVEKKPMKKEPVKSPQEPVRTGVIPATRYSVLSATKENINEEECKGKIVSNTPRVKIEEPIRSVSSGSLAGVEREVKNMLAENTGGQINLGYPEPKLKTKEALAPNKGNCKSEPSTALRNIELSLGPNNFRCENIQKLFQIQEKTNLVSLNLSVGSKGKCSTKGQVHNNKCSSTDADLCANRAMWDLNTTMDEWEGSVNDAPACEDSEHTSNISISTTSPCEPQKFDDSLNLRLTPYLDSCLSQGQSNLPARVNTEARVNTDTVCRNLTMQKVLMPVPKSNVSDHSIVKSEPFVDSPNQNLTGIKDNSKEVLESRNLKSELIERRIPFLNSGIPTLSGPRPIKSELVVGVDQIANKAIGVTSNLSNKCLELSITEQKTETSAVASGHSTYLQESTYREEVPQKTCATVAGSTYEIVTVCFGQEVNRSNVSDRKAVTENIGLSIDNGMGFGSDEEKINILADLLEEDSYSYDDESDGNHEFKAAMDRVHRGEEDEYEDGEVREQVVQAATELNICEKGEEKDISGENDNISGLTGDETTSYVEESECKTEYLGKDCNDHSAELVDKVIDEKLYQGTDKDASLLESMAIESITTGPEKKQPVKTIETEEHSDQATYKSQIASVTLNHGVEVSIKEATLEGKNVSAPHNADIYSNVNDAAKETSSGGNRNRIINLKASNASSSCKTRYLSEPSLPSRIAREKYSDSVIEGDKLYYPRREEFYNDGSHKYSREGNRDQPFRNSRGNYNRGRGRSSSRQNTTRGDWSSDREFPPAYYNNDSTGSRFSRQKLGTTVNDKEFACDGYIVGPDERAVGSGRGGRKSFNDETRPFRQFSSRGKSPGRRDGTAARGVQTVRRFSRNYSPRRIGEDGSEFVGRRYNENFVRGSPDIVVDPMLTRSQPSFEAREGRFVRENRNFVSMQSRGPTRIRSKSPTRHGPHSPAQWSSPRRRSPDAFNVHRRSGVIYRTRSPGSSLPAETVPRRHGSPIYMPRIAIDMDSGREHVTHRPVRVVPRNNRRPDILEPNERADTDEYFDSPGHPIQFQELEGEVNGDERRRYGERRGPVRSFRPPMDAEGENFQYNAEDDSRSYRFRPEGDSEFNTRENLRERDLDRRIKTRSGPGHSPRRMRNIEDDEVNFRQGGQGWNDEEFDDTRLKRRRF